MRQGRLETVTASEIGTYVYCPEQWRLSALGLLASNQAVRDTGTRHHEQKAAVETVAGASIQLGIILIGAAVFVGLLLWSLLN